MGALLFCFFSAYCAQFVTNKIGKTLEKSRVFQCGGEGEIRTLAPLSRPTPLAGAPLHQLEYFSNIR